MIALIPVSALILTALSPFHGPLAPAAHHAPPAPVKHHHSAPRHPGRAHKAHRAPQAAPYHVWDSTTPSNIPAGKQAALYATGAFYATKSQTVGHGPVLWVDVFGHNYEANVVDVEPGDATPQQAADWAHARVDKHPGVTAIIYVAKAHWQEVRHDVSALPKHVQENVRYWVTDPTGVDHVVPGSSGTQWDWNKGTDISTMLPSLTKAGA